MGLSTKKGIGKRFSDPNRGGEGTLGKGLGCTSFLRIRLMGKGRALNCAFQGDLSTNQKPKKRRNG